MTKKILVIEDDPIATRLMEYILKKRGYHVLATTNGLEGLQLARKENPDLIILNVMLPGIDGLEVCHRLRSDAQMTQPLVLMLSGKAQQADITNGLKIGADDYLTKPATPSEIVNRVESLLAQKVSTNSKIIVFVGSKKKTGTTSIVVNVAITIAQMGKQVIAVDFDAEDGAIAEYLGIKPQVALRRLLKTSADGSGYRAPDPALGAHETGVGVMSIRQPYLEPESMKHDDIDLPFDRFRDTTDFFLVDLPFEPTLLNRTLLARCDLAIIVSDHTTEALTGVKSTVTAMRFLGIPLKRIAAVITDPVGTFPQKELPNIKSYIEPNIAVSVWGMIPYEANATTAPSFSKPPIILSHPDCPMACAIKELAQRIITAEIKNDATRDVVKRA